LKKDISLRFARYFFSEESLSFLIKFISIRIYTLALLYLQDQNSMAKQSGKLRERLTNKYRMVILNEETFEERFSFKLSRLNVYVFGSLFAIVLIIFTSLLIAFTPLREYVPGYSSTALKKKATDLTYQLDLLENEYQINNTKLKAMMSVIKGDEAVTDYYQGIDSIIQLNKDSLDAKKLFASTADSVFRNTIDSQDKFNVNTSQSVIIGTVLFAPVTGTITNEFNSEEEHFAVDIAVKKDAPIKAVADGTVIFSEWSVDTGFVIIVDHGSNLLSVYKHNSQLYKKQGELVKLGEVIASAGSAGTLSTATHLHFELWYNSYPIDPTNFMDFE
jgi:murein DD-endopeptidase MepM/ murein hydrolase activator NlpD